MPQVAVRATRVVVRALVIPVADHTRGKDQQRDERQGNCDDADSPAHNVCGRAKLDANPSNSNWMWDVGKALPVTKG